MILTIRRLHSNAAQRLEGSDSAAVSSVVVFVCSLQDSGHGSSGQLVLTDGAKVVHSVLFDFGLKNSLTGHFADA